ncbi:MAG: hypothetical protein PHQ43_15860 [Dehalococcoidales bacterium]|nr:hypothetical protein [Dehalococcoidales bacterium]
MKGQCDHYPVRFVQSRGKIQFRFNVVAEEIPVEGGTKTIYRYDYVEADEPTRESVLAAMSVVDGAEEILDAAGEIVVGEEPSIT